MASPLRAMTLAETEEDAHLEEAVSKTVAPENNRGLQDAGYLEAPEDFSEGSLGDSLELEGGYDRETLATTEENAPVQEPRPRIVTPEKIKGFTDKELEDFPNHLFIEI